MAIQWEHLSPDVSICCADCLEVLPTLEAGSVQCCVTSPPYWGLRDYKVEGQLGLEKTPEEYVAKLVEVFREVRRVLRDDGTLWMNLGDSYNAGTSSPSKPSRSTDVGGHTSRCGEQIGSRRVNMPGLKPKDLCGIPWMVAFALRADGWYLRQDIIWHKPNPMPESVRDRCTKSHEYLFLLSKSKNYYFDDDAVREPSEGTDPRLKRSPAEVSSGAMRRSDMEGYGLTRGNVNQPCCNPLGRNKRSVWSIPTRAYSGAHFATFPPKLVEPCILAGCPAGGTVIDPFFGSGTTAEVSLSLGRKCIGLELSPDYVELAKSRVRDELARPQLPFPEPEPPPKQREMFAHAD